VADFLPYFSIYHQLIDFKPQAYCPAIKNENSDKQHGDADYSTSFQKRKYNDNIFH